MRVPPELLHWPGFYEPFSAISHLAGAVLFAALGGLLLWRGRGSRARLFFLGVYAASCVLLFSMSAVYHMTERGGPAWSVMARLDHGAIFVLIAGTFTPAHGILLRGWRRWAPLALIWSAAIAGITLKTIFFDSTAEWMGLTFYLTLGWFGLLSAISLGRRYGVRFLKPLLLGGLAYTVGACMEFARWPIIVPGAIHAHDVFHLAVLMGAFFHWLFIWQFADGRLTELAAPELIDLAP